MFLNYLGQTLLHNLWQGGVLFIPLFILIKVLPGPRLRVPLLFSSLLLLVISGGVTYEYLSGNRELPALERTLPVKNTGQDVSVNNTFNLNSSDDRSLPSEEVQDHNEGVPQVSGKEIVIKEVSLSEEANRFHMNFKNWFLLSRIPISVHAVLGAVWLLGAFFMLLRLILAVNKGHSLRKRAEILTEGALYDMGLKAAQKLKLPPAAIALSKEILTPCVTGIFRMTILIPASMATGQEEEVLMAVFLHEYSHILKRDVLFHFLMIIIRSFLFFNPFVWWISYELEKEREYRCDLFTSRLMGDSEGYARILYNWGAMQKESIVPASAFGGNSPDLTSRVKKVLGFRVSLKAPGSFLASSFSILILAVFLLAGCLGVKEGVRVVQNRVTEEERDAALFNLNEKGISLSWEIYSEEGSLEDVDVYFYTPYDWVMRETPQVLKTEKGEEYLKGENSTWHHSMRLSVCDPRWAPLISPMYSLKNGDGKEVQKLVLKKGITRRFLVTDSKGNPLPDAVMGYRIEKEDFSCEQSPWFKAVSDGQGYITFREDEPYIIKGKLFLTGYDSLSVELHSSGEKTLVMAENLVMDEAKTYKTQLINNTTGEPLGNHSVEYVDFNTWQWTWRVNVKHEVFTDDQGYLTYNFDKNQDILYISTETEEGKTLIPLYRKEIQAKINITPRKIKGRFYGTRKQLENISFLIAETSDIYNKAFGLTPVVTEEDPRGFLNFILPVDCPGEYIYAYSHVTGFKILFISSVEALSKGLVLADENHPGQYSIEVTAPKAFSDVKGSLVVELFENNESAGEVRTVELDREKGSLFIEERFTRAVIYPNGLRGHYFSPFEVDLKEADRKIVIEAGIGGIIRGKLLYSDGSAPESSYPVALLNYGPKGQVVKYDFTSEKGTYFLGHLKPEAQNTFFIDYGFCPPEEVEVKTDMNNLVINMDLTLKRYPDLKVTVKTHSSHKLKLITETHDGQIRTYFYGSARELILSNFDLSWYKKFQIRASAVNGDYYYYDPVEMGYSNPLNLDFTL